MPFEVVLVIATLFIGLPWLVLQITGDPLALGVVLALLRSLGDDLHFVLLTSGVKLVEVASEAEQTVRSRASAHRKCERCWHYADDVGHNADHPTICGRCVSNLFGDGETRIHA